MKIYTKILLTTLPLVLIALLAGAGTTYYLSRNAINNLAENWLSTRLSESVEIATEHEKILHAYGLETIEASVTQAQTDASTKIISIEIGELGYVYVVNIEGQIVAHPNQSLIGHDVSNQDWFQEIRLNQNDHLSYSWEGMDYFGVYTYFPAWEWHIIATDPESEVYGAVNQLGIYVVILAVIGSVILALGLMLLTQRLIAPLYLLTKGAEQIIQGDLNTRIVIDTSDEFKRLADVFNKMTKQLHELIDSLEQRVAERTEQLEHQAEVLQNQQATLEEYTSEIEIQALDLQASKTELEKINHKLTELNASKDKFFSIVAHDLKNPFLPLLGLSELLDFVAESAERSELKEYGHIIHQSAKNIYNLLTNLLDWARMQQGRMPFNPEPFLVNEAAMDNIMLLSESAKAKNIVLSANIPNNIMVHADKNMVTTIIRNLVSNALKFTPRDEHVEIKIMDQELGASGKTTDSYIEVHIKDSGIGIKPEDIDKLFRIDVHHTTQGTNKESGTGLGLIMCKEMVEKHNGKIWVESKYGHGTTVKFTLPK
ncbi:MAG: hypothetical protein B6242_12425 [Anaerolineaceae bacterium 4572_78]|nr:MAG: hypothetical protein B6242_12425 [Anaerolineaceae bacterium 4572_78]